MNTILPSIVTVCTIVHVCNTHYMYIYINTILTSVVTVCACLYY